MVDAVDYVDTAVSTSATWDGIRTGAANSQTITIYVIFDGNVYAALCPELDIATDADTPTEALFQLRSAIREVMAEAAASASPVGQAVSDADLAEFLSQHHSPRFPITTYVLPLSSP